MKKLLILYLVSFSFSQGEPLDTIIINPNFIIETTKITNVEQLHTLNYDGSKIMKIPIVELAKLHDKKFVRQLIMGNFSVENGEIKVIDLNRFEILNSKVLVPSKRKGTKYLLDREILLKLLNEQITINWNNWSDILVDHHF